MRSEDLVASVQAAIDANPDYKGKVTASYDTKLQQLVFTTTGTDKVTLSSKQSIIGLSDDLVQGVNDQSVSLSLSPLTSTASYRATNDQRYGIKVSFGDEGFSISSGATGDNSSIAIFGASDIAKELFGLSSATDAKDGNNVSVALTPARGISSEPAVLVGNTIGVNLNNKFRVDTTNNTFVVSVDNVSGTVQVPAKDDYTIYSFAAELERRINAMVDNEGRTVNGVKVNVEQTGNGTGRLSFTTGTTGNNSFMRVSGDSVWGLSDIGSARGTTSLWVPNIESLQATNTGNSLLYVSAEDDNNFAESTQASNDTLPEWVPVFLDKGELTFDSKGNLSSPTVATRDRKSVV